MPETDPMETMSPGDSQNDVWLIRWVARNASRAGVVVLNEGERDMLMRAASELAALRQQLTESQADREGLDWLEANGGRTFFRYVGDGWIDERSGVKHPSLRATIDAARLASSSEPPPTTETPE